jgi:hypothetical protein
VASTAIGEVAFAVLDEGDTTTLMVSTGSESDLARGRAVLVALTSSGLDDLAAHTLQYDIGADPDSYAADDLLPELESWPESPAAYAARLEELFGPPPSKAELQRLEARAHRRQQDALDVFAANAMTTEDVARHLGVPARAVLRRRRAGELVAVRRGREWFYPRWQFHDGAPLPRLSELIAAWPGSALELANWAVKANVEFNERRPAHVWRRDPDRVLDEVPARIE